MISSMSARSHGRGGIKRKRIIAGLLFRFQGARSLVVAERSFRRLDAPELLAEVAEGVVYANGERVKRTHNEADEFGNTLLGKTS